MSARAVLTVVLTTLLCLALIGRPRADAAHPETAEQAAPASALPSPAAVNAPEMVQRPALLMPLYVSFATLQALDVHSTLRAPQFGGREANPVLQGVVGSPAGFIAAKAGVAAGTIVVTEKLWKRNRAAAIITMLALNSTYSVVVAHNYAVEARAARGR